MTALSVLDSPKMLRETLCVAQARIGNSILDADRRDEHIQRLQHLIDECDRHRPLGPGGRHGDLHTLTCGCEPDDPAQLDEQRRGWRGWLLDHAAADATYEQIEWVVVALLDIGIDEPPDQPDRPEPVDPESGAGLIAAERARQINDEGRTAEHDDGHPLGELLDAATAYLLRDREYWPWGESAWKPVPDDRVRELVKVGALIAAEIDRLHRAEPDPAVVGALTYKLIEVGAVTPGFASDYARELAKRNVQVVSTDG